MGKKFIVVAVGLVVSGILNVVNHFRVDKLQKEVDKCSETCHQTLDEVSRYLKASPAFFEMSEAQMNITANYLKDLDKMTKEVLKPEDDGINPNDVDVTLSDETLFSGIGTINGKEFEED